MNIDMMICRGCGFSGDDVQDFISTGIPGERICPHCGSNQCYVTNVAFPPFEEDAVLP